MNWWSSLVATSVTLAIAGVVAEREALVYGALLVLAAAVIFGIVSSLRGNPVSFWKAHDG